MSPKQSRDDLLEEALYFPERVSRFRSIYIASMYGAGEQTVTWALKMTILLYLCQADQNDLHIGVSWHIFSVQRATFFSPSFLGSPEKPDS